MHTRTAQLPCWLLWAALGLLATSACRPSGRHDPQTVEEGDTDGDSDLPPGDTDTPACKGSAASIHVANAQSLNPLIEHPSYCRLYGADSSGGVVYFIDTATDALQKSVAVGNQPVDLVLSSDGRFLYVAVFGDSKIVVLDAETGALVQEVFTVEPPFRIAQGPDDRAFYVKETVFSAVREVNFFTGLDTQLTTGLEFQEPDIVASSDGHDVFVAEGNKPGARLVHFDASLPGFPEADRYTFNGGFTLPTPTRRVWLAEGSSRVYFAERGFDATNLSRLRGWLGDEVVASSPDGHILASPTALYDGQTFLRFGERAHPKGGALFSRDGHWFYEFDPLGSQLYRTSVTTLVGTHQLGQTQVAPGSLAQHDFSQLVADPARPLLWGLDSQQNELVAIDRNTLLPLSAEIVGSAPTDLAISQSAAEMVVATFGATELAVVDLTNTEKSIKETLFTPGNPFRVAISATGRIVYAEQDQWGDLVLVDESNGDVLATLADTLFQADVEFDASGRYLYAGEAAAPEARLLRYDLQTDSFTAAGVSSATYSYPSRRVIFNSGFVYYAGHKFDSATLADLGGFGEEIVLVTNDGRFAVSRRHVFDTTTFAEVLGLPVDSGLVAAAPDAPILYQFDNDTGAIFVQGIPTD